MTTVRQVINGALKKLGAIDAEDGPSASEVSDALGTVNRMLYNWSVQRNGIYVIKTEQFTLTGGQAEYTYGSGGDFDSPRPILINRSYFRDNGVDTTILETTYENFADIGDKDISSYPKVFLHTPEYPLAKLTFYPVPDSSYTVFFQTWKPLAQYTSSSNDLNLPPEYEEAIEWNLALRLAPEYLMEAPQTVAMMAQSSFRDLKNLHSRPVPQINTSIMSDQERSYSIYEDE